MTKEYTTGQEGVRVWDVQYPELYDEVGNHHLTNLGNNAFMHGHIII